MEFQEEEEEVGLWNEEEEEEAEEGEEEVEAEVEGAEEEEVGDGASKTLIDSRAGICREPPRNADDRTNISQNVLRCFLQIRVG